MKKLLTLAIVLSALLIAVPVAQAGTLCVNTDGTGDCYSSIQDAIDAASDGDTINVAEGTYAETLNITTDNLSIIGAGRTSVTIDVRGHASNNSGIYVPADGVTLQGFTLVGGPSVTTPRYGIKFGSSDGSTLNDVLVRDCYRTGVDILGASNLTISNVEAKDNGGNGLQACDANGVTFSNITTSGNAWGGVGIFTYGNYTPIGTDDIVFSGTNSFGETSTDDGGLYLEEGNYGDPPNPYPITYSTNPADNANVTVLLSDFTHTLHGDSDNNNIYTRFYATLNDAVSAAGGSPGHITTGRYIRSLADGSFYVANGMSIQDAIDAASDGDTINVAAGTYNETVKLKSTTASDISVIGENKATTFITRGISFGADYSGLKVQNFTISGNGFLDTETYEATVAHSWKSGHPTVTNLEFSDCIFDGEGYDDGRHGRCGVVLKKLGGVVKFENNEFKNYRGWATLDVNDQGESVTSYTFRNNNVHDNWGSCALRGNPSNRTDTVTVTGNTFNNNGNPAAYSWSALEINEADSVTVSDNTITNTQPGSWWEGEALQFWHITALNVTGNTIANNYQGIYFPGSAWASDLSGVHINFNNIYGNTQFGIKAEADNTGTADATNNWWGSPTGPCRQLPNGKWVGKGDKVSSNVDYIPWLPHPIEFWHHLPRAQ